MAFNNLVYSSIVQTGMLERAFQKPLRAMLGFREIAQRVPFAAEIGESIIKTRGGLLPTITAPLAPAANTDITSGLIPQNWAVEQYILSVNQWAAQQTLNVVTSRVGIADQFLENAEKLAEQAIRSVDAMAAKALYGAYLGGQTVVRTALTAAGATIAVDDIRGFQNTINSQGQSVPISNANPVTVIIGTDAGVQASTANTYTLILATADATNVSTAPGGISGTLTFSTSVTQADGALANTVMSAVCTPIIRPNGSTTIKSLTSTNTLTVQMLLDAKANLEANNVPTLTSSGMYRAYLQPQQMTGLYADPAYQRFATGQLDSDDVRRGKISELVGLEIVRSNMCPISTVGGTRIYNALVVGQDAMVEGEFTRNGYAGAEDVADDDIVIVDGIAHVVRKPIDALLQVATQTWSYIGGFVVPTDTTTDVNSIPSATNAAYKRATVVQSA